MLATNMFQLRIPIIHIVVLFCLLFNISCCRTDVYKIQSDKIELDKMDPLRYKDTDSSKKIYYGIKDGKESLTAVYACFYKDTLYQIQIARNHELFNKKSQYRLFDETEIHEQLSLFQQIFSFISKKYKFDNVERIMINPCGIKAMSFELFQKFDSCGNYVQAIKDCYYFSELFELFKSYGINIKNIEVNDIYWEKFDNKNDPLSIKANNWDNINLNARIFLYTVRIREK